MVYAWRPDPQPGWTTGQLPHRNFQKQIYFLGTSYNHFASLENIQLVATCLETLRWKECVTNRYTQRLPTSFGLYDVYFHFRKRAKVLTFRNASRTAVGARTSVR